jgi:hypothetical protein
VPIIYTSIDTIDFLILKEDFPALIISWRDEITIGSTPTSISGTESSRTLLKKGDGANHWRRG